MLPVSSDPPWRIQEQAETSLRGGPSAPVAGSAQQPDDTMAWLHRGGHCVFFSTLASRKSVTAL